MDTIIKVHIDNIIYYLQDSGGISCYWSELGSRLLADKNIRLTVNYSPHYSKNIFGTSLFQGDTKPIFGVASRYLDYSVPANVVTHSSYYRCPRKRSRNVVHVTTVHDFIYEKYNSGIRRALHSMQKNRAIRNSNGVIAITENTKADILYYLPELDPSRIRVIYNGVSTDYQPLKEGKYKKYSKHVLFVGNRAGYKNFVSAVEAVSMNANMKLLILGPQLNAKEIKILNSFLPERYEFISHIPNSELNKLYNSVFALVYPSYYEGFGIPVVEAMKAGCPFIAYNGSSIPEVAGNAGCLLERIDGESICSSLDKLKDGSYRNEKIEQGIVQSRKFSWEKCYQETIEFYESLM